MFQAIGIFVAGVFFLLANASLAGTIYTWTDADGVKRYSDTAPPDGAQNVRAIDEFQSSQDNGNRARQEYERMVEEANQEANRHFEEQAEKKARAREDEQNREAAKRRQRLERECQKLQQELESIQNRGLSPTFSAGQKEYLTGQVQEKIDKINEALTADINR